MIKYEDVKNQTTEDYFKDNKFSIDAFNKKYAAYPGETYIQALKRVVDAIASVEKTVELRKRWSDIWFDEIYNDWWHPAGSIMQGAGSNRKISLANCTTNSLGILDDGKEWDSLEGISNAAYTVMKCAAYRQGLGIAFDRLRPRGTSILNSAKVSSGALHWMTYIDSLGYRVGQHGRIPAMLFSLGIKHPDIEEFITAKSDFTKIQNANISVQITNDFYKAVEDDEDWELKFVIPAVKKGDKVYIDINSVKFGDFKDADGNYYIATHNKAKEVFSKTIKAKKLLELIAKNMHSHAEPGVQNIDIARKYSNSDYLYEEGQEYDPRILSTNACSEQYLSRDSLCVLASLNVGKFATTAKDYLNELEVHSRSINRFLDNVNEYELITQTYATEFQALAIRKLRRTGAGFTNLHAWLFKQHLEYGSEKGNEVAEEFIKAYCYHLYRSTIDLGKEKGSFEMFDKEKIKKSAFIKRLIKEFPTLEFDTMRNVTVITIAPTGTLSLMFRDLVMSYGAEQGFGLYFWKRTRISGKYEYYFNVPNGVRVAFEEAGFKIPIESDTIKDTWDGKFGKPIAEFIDKNKEKVGIIFKNASEIPATDKLGLLSKLMKWVDSSISITFMLPESSTWKDVYNFILEGYHKEVKSIAAFPDKKMYGIVAYVPFKELAFKLKKEGVEIHPQNFDVEEQEQVGIYDVKTASTTELPKRPKVLDADIYIVTIKGEKFIIVIGLLNGNAYEIFGGHMNGLGFKFTYKEGKIEKVKRGQYRLEIGEDISIEDFGKQFTPTEQSTFRLVSASLRHGVPLSFIVEQLQKSTDDMFSMTAAASRVLKKYIKDGVKAIGQSCPACESIDLIYAEGCVSCKCGWSKCQ
jgi:ribonucleoside-diphosphate reductase alpha chain